MQTYLQQEKKTGQKQANIPITEGKLKEMWFKTGSSYLPKVKRKWGQYFYF